MRTLSAWDKRRLKETARIKALVYEAGLAFSDIDRLHGLRPGAARDIRPQNQNDGIGWQASFANGVNCGCLTLARLPPAQLADRFGGDPNVRDIKRGDNGWIKTR